MNDAFTTDTPGTITLLCEPEKLPPLLSCLSGEHLISCVNMTLTPPAVTVILKITLVDRLHKQRVTKDETGLRKRITNTLHGETQTTREYAHVARFLTEYASDLTHITVDSEGIHIYKQKPR